MKIILISPPTFNKNRGAAQKDTFATIELLKDMGHDVTLYAIGTGFPYEATAVKEISSKLNIEIRLFMPNLTNWWKWIYFVLFKNPIFADRASYVFEQLAEDKTFNEFLHSWKPDLVFSFCCFSWPVLKLAKELRIPSVFRSHNYEANFFWESLKFHEMFYPQNWVRFLAKKYEEKNSVIYSDAIAALPFAEVEKYRNWKKKNIFILTVTFPYKSLRPVFVHENKNPLEVFYLGASYNISFHLLGAKALIEDIAPKVIERAPGNFRFHICGGKLPEYLKKQCDGKNIIYEDYVEDFEQFMSRMDIAAFPTWTGTTIKGKVCETLARAFPMVIPKNCLGTYDLKNGTEILLAETVEEFVDAICSLTDEKLREKLSQGAANFADAHFSKKALTQILRDTILAAKLSSEQEL